MEDFAIVCVELQSSNGERELKYYSVRTIADRIPTDLELAEEILNNDSQGKREVKFILHTNSEVYYRVFCSQIQGYLGGIQEIEI